MAGELERNIAAVAAKVGGNKLSTIFSKSSYLCCVSFCFQQRLAFNRSKSLCEFSKEIFSKNSSGELTMRFEAYHYSKMLKSYSIHFCSQQLQILDTSY